jgi:uncharacterized protein YlxW (UPF0749 family)
MSETPDKPLSVEERFEEVEDKLLKLDSSRRWHLWVLVLLVFTTCGYGTVDTTSNNTSGLSNDVGELRRNVTQLNRDVGRLSDAVERLQEELKSTQEALERPSTAQASEVGYSRTT